MIIKKLTLYLLISIFLCSCASSTNSKTSEEGTTSTDKTYGYTEKNPIKVGGVGNGPINERNYLNSLTGPNGEKVTYERRGSCCAFTTKKSPFGGGLLDIYAVTYEGKNDTISLYLNMYDKANLKAPIGFKMK